MKTIIVILASFLAASLCVNIVVLKKLSTIRENAWDNSLQNYAVAVAADRAKTLEEIQQRHFANPNEILNEATNSLGLIIDEPVLLKGRVDGIGKHDVGVDSSLGKFDQWWPQRKDGKLVQGGFFELRNAAHFGYLPAGNISGTGTEPLPLVLTNHLGERIIKMSYIFTPEK